MKPHITSLVNALILIVFSLWGFLSSDTPSYTALIPTGFGVAILFMYRGIKNHHKLIANLAVFLTIMVMFGLIKPLQGAMGREDSIAVFRVSVMLLSTFLSLIFFLLGFIGMVSRYEENK